MKINSVNRKLELVTAVMTAALAALMIFQRIPGQNYRTQLSVGSRFLQEENYEKAEAAFQEAIKIDDKKPEPYIGLGSSYTGQADAILVKYQSKTKSNGTIPSSGQSDTEGDKKEDSDVRISSEEKETLQNLYQKAQEAYRQASTMDTDDNGEIKNSISYVDQRQKEAEKLQTSDDPKPTETPTPSPTATPTAEPDLKSLVDLNGGQTIPVPENSSVDSVDLDGDGQKDTVSFSTEVDDGNYITYLSIEVNGNTVMNFDDISNISGMEYAMDPSLTILQMNDGKVFLAFNVGTEDGLTLVNSLYIINNGRMNKMLDLSPIDDTGASKYQMLENFKVAGNTISFDAEIMTASFSVVRMERTLLYHDNKLIYLEPNEVEVSDPINAGGDDFYTVKAPLNLYAKGDPGEDANPVDVLQAGTRCTITKAYFTNDTHIQRLFLTTDDGKSGWFDQGAHITDANGSIRPIFDGRTYGN